MNTSAQIQNIVSDTGTLVKDKIDALLALDSANYTNLGIDSTKKERKEVKSASRAIYKAIKGLDKTEGELLLSAFD